MYAANYLYIGEYSIPMRFEYFVARYAHFMWGAGAAANITSQLSNKYYLYRICECDETWYPLISLWIQITRMECDADDRENDRVRGKEVEKQDDNE